MFDQVQNVLTKYITYYLILKKLTARNEMMIKESIKELQHRCKKYSQNNCNFSQIIVTFPMQIYSPNLFGINMTIGGLE
jgi:translation initiation factor 2 beta subunit (eIF-2beta)/eIF-5